MSYECPCNTNGCDNPGCTNRPTDPREKMREIRESTEAYRSGLDQNGDALSPVDVEEPEGSKAIDYTVGGHEKFETPMIPVGGFVEFVKTNVSPGPYWDKDEFIDPKTCELKLGDIVKVTNGLARENSDEGLGMIIREHPASNGFTVRLRGGDEGRLRQFDGREVVRLREELYLIAGASPQEGTDETEEGPECGCSACKAEMSEKFRPCDNVPELGCNCPEGDCLVGVPEAERTNPGPYWDLQPGCDGDRDFDGDTLPSDSQARKGIPLASGCLDYFPAAFAEVAKVSKFGNDKHNPGQPLHHARGKSMDHADALLRHLVDRGKIDKDTGMRHSAEVAWRALALLQEELEAEGLAPLPRGARLS